jgi:hypothetical protein
MGRKNLKVKLFLERSTKAQMESRCITLLYNGYRVFPVGKAVGCSVDHPPPTSAEVEERV